MQVADLVLPVFAIIVTGWLAGRLGYVSRSLADALVHFAYMRACEARRTGVVRTCRGVKLLSRGGGLRAQPASASATKVTEMISSFERHAREPSGRASVLTE